MSCFLHLPYRISIAPVERLSRWLPHYVKRGSGRYESVGIAALSGACIFTYPHGGGVNRIAVKEV